ncbi:1-phosphatidylinositol phosphodiesterase [Ceratocystis lukuohia]|uniref:1-phosphatidylinositol phosphodiesterase n=1 Tax=Ceratocystis lukuohia TaxID=2019550 RepID=A0ABR4MA93_9PEZI
MRLSLFTTLFCLAFSHAGHYKDIYDIWSFDLGQDTFTDWMSTMEDTVFLSQLAIPGTHNSMTDRIEDSRLQTQNVPLFEQLRGGIRYIDISCRCIDNHIMVYNEAVDTGYSLDDVLTTIYNFLDEHSRETIILRIQNGGISDDSKSFLGCIERYFVPGTKLGDRADQYIYSRNADNSIPILGHVRGKVLILQDFKSSPPGRYGIPWGSRSVSSYNRWFPSGVLWLGLKWAGVKANLNRAPSQYHNKLRITHTTASAGVSPIIIAAKEGDDFGMNRRLGRYIMTEEGNCQGVVVMDFPGNHLIYYFMRWNARYRVSTPDDGYPRQFGPATPDDDYPRQFGPATPDELDHDEVDDDGEAPPDESSDDEASDDEAGDNEAREDKRAPAMFR